MSWFLKLAFVLGICAVSATAMSVQMKDGSELAMTKEEEALFAKMSTVFVKAKALNALKRGASGELAFPEKRTSADGDCSVTGNTGKCCGALVVDVDLWWDEYTYSVSACATVEYLPDNYGVYITVVVDGQTIVSTEVSAVNPPAVCEVVAPFVEVCLQLTEVHLNTNTGAFSACVNILGKVAFITVTTLQVGCIDF